MRGHLPGRDRLQVRRAFREDGEWRRRTEKGMSFPCGGGTRVGRAGPTGPPYSRARAAGTRTAAAEVGAGVRIQYTP